VTKEAISQKVDPLLHPYYLGQDIKRSKFYNKNMKVTGQIRHYPLLITHLIQAQHKAQKCLNIELNTSGCGHATMKVSSIRNQLSYNPIFHLSNQ